ncbi:MAG: DUF6758 family protein [Actinomycetes bacterium]
MPARCPRCGRQLPTQSFCPRHGDVDPLAPPVVGDPDQIRQWSGRSAVPVWAPRLPVDGWRFGGVAGAGEESRGWRAAAVCLAGPNPFGGRAEMVLVAEEPGVGLGAGLAGLPVPDPVLDPQRPADAKVHALGHPTPLWFVQTDGGPAVYVGEAEGCWLWVVLWPAPAGLLVAEDLDLVDLRDGLGPWELRAGPACRRLSPRGTGQ